MLNTDQVAAYHRDGFIHVENALSPELLARVRAWVDDCVDRARGVAASNETYDFEESHTPESPRVRRIKDPVSRDPLFWEVVRNPGITEPLTQLLGPDIRLFGSKLNMKSAGYGAAVEWHQDWAFYPHSNDDVLAVGIMLDDVTAENGPLLVLPGTHTGPVYDHHNDEGLFVGGIENVESKLDLSQAVPIHGRAGSMSVHHVRAVHGSALNLSGRPRRILFYEIAAADAWPLWSDVTATKYRNQAHFQDLMLAGEHSNNPRLAAVPVRMPAAWKGGKVDSIFAAQNVSKQRYFGALKEPAGVM
jgi:ectoine hydroxylase-related dioxygenase (phytanoyl-CoA dioxygenase family)